MSDDPTYTENIRKLTTASEQDDAVSAGKILSQLGPENWGKAVKDMLSLNKQDWQDMEKNQRWDLFIPLLNAEMEKSGTNETVTINQGTFHVAQVTEDITGRKIDSPIDPSKDVVRQLTSAAEDGDAIAAARILKAVGTEKWEEVTKDMLALNHEDILAAIKKAGDNIPQNLPAHLSIGYKREGLDETIQIFRQTDLQDQTRLAKVTDRKF